MADDDKTHPAARPASEAELRPSRSTTIAIGAALLAGVVFAIVRAPRRPPEASPVDGPPAPQSSTTTPPADRLASAIRELESLPPLEPPSLDKIWAALDGVAATDKGQKLPDGTLPPPLPESAPKSVRFGVVLVRYQGAQLAPADAPSRDAALSRATLIAELARSDFAAAVKAGDPGSATDIGLVRRGILEPGTQYVLFTLAPGATSPVLDTPRGFWIVKRIR